MPLPNLPTIQQVPGGGDYLQAPIYSPTQENVFERLLQLGGQRLENPTQGFQPFEDRARQQFFQNTIPGLAERFTAMGGGQKSSAFQGTLGQAGSDLESQLAQLRQTYGQQQEQMGLNMLGTGLTPQYNQAYYQPASVAGQVTQGLTNAATQLAPPVISGILNHLGGAATQNPAATAAVTGAVAGGVPAAIGATTGTAAPAAATALPAAAGAGAGTAVAGKGALGAAAKAGTLATALNAVGAIGMPIALGTLGVLWLYGLLKGDPSQPGQFPNPFPDGNYTDKDGNRVESQGNIIKIYDQSGNLIDSATFAEPNAGRTTVPQGGRLYNYFGGTKPVSGPFTRGT